MNTSEVRVLLSRPRETRFSFKFLLSQTIITSLLRRKTRGSTLGFGDLPFFKKRVSYVSFRWYVDDERVVIRLTGSNQAKQGNQVCAESQAGKKHSEHLLSRYTRCEKKRK